MIKERLPNYTQVCVFPGLLVDENKIQVFTDLIKEAFDTRVQYLETILTKPDVDDPENTGGRSDVFFAVHQDDIGKFAVRRLQYGIRWIEDAMSNVNGYHLNPIYPEYVEGYNHGMLIVIPMTIVMMTIINGGIMMMIVKKVIKNKIRGI